MPTESPSGSDLGLDENLIRLAFAGMHPDRVRSLLTAHSGPAGAVAALRRGKEAAEPSTLAALAVDPRERERQLARAGVGLLGPECFPASLLDRPDRPPFLFVRGQMPSEAAVAIVGTRRCTAYGRRIAQSYGLALARTGVPVVSGLARGIDGAAHAGVRDAGGIGVAVMGCGLDRVYPREHHSLLSDLLRYGGAAVSEYPLGAPPTGWRFPARNRIISLLSEVVIVVEANDTGGALITARHALEQSKEVLATPGDITRRSSAGTNALIRDGALPVFDAEDLLATLGLIPAFAHLTTPASASRLDGPAELPAEDPADGVARALAQSTPGSFVPTAAARDLLGSISRSGTDLESLVSPVLQPARLRELVASLEHAGAVRVDGRIATRLWSIEEPGPIQEPP